MTKVTFKRPDGRDCASHLVELHGTGTQQPDLSAKQTVNA
jgi:hypothetical protein